MFDFLASIRSKFIDFPRCVVLTFAFGKEKVISGRPCINFKLIEASASNQNHLRHIWNVQTWAEVHCGSSLDQIKELFDQ